MISNKNKNIATLNGSMLVSVSIALTNLTYSPTFAYLHTKKSVKNMKKVYWI